jgi:ABC-type sugar transport system substrate-binding protein
VGTSFCEAQGNVPGTIAILSLAKDSQLCTGAAVPGFREAIRTLCPQHVLDIRYTPYISSGKRADAKLYMEELLLSDSHVDTVFSCSEALAMGALDAVKSARPDKLFHIKVSIRFNYQCY